MSFEQLLSCKVELSSFSFQRAILKESSYLSSSDQNNLPNESLKNVKINKSFLSYTSYAFYHLSIRLHIFIHHSRRTYLFNYQTMLEINKS